jgi:NitT/TauT family transport system substrate-binding protein
MQVAKKIAIALLVAGASLASMPSWAADTIHVRFSWKLKGEYGFFYLGKDKGIYAKHGIDIDLGEGAGAQAALGALVQGNEDIVVAPAIFAISAIHQGMPVKLAAIYQRNTPIAFISKPERPVTTPKGMEGHSLAVSIGDTATTYLDVFCKINDIDCKKINQVQLDPQVKFPQFMQDRVDLITVYRNVDLPLIEARTGIKFAVLDLPKYGLSVPGLGAIVSDAGIAGKADVLKRFFAATNEAIELTRKDPDAATKALMNAWSAAPSTELVKEQIVATSATLDSPSGKPNGWIEESTITDAQDLILSTAKEGGKKKPASDFYTNKLLEP